MKLAPSLPCAHQSAADVSGILDFLRQARWLNRERGRAYALMIAISLGIAISYSWAYVALGYYPGKAATQAGKPGISDFLTFWCAGKLTLEGHPASAWDMAAIGPEEHQTTELEAGTTLPFYYPPPTLLLCAPLAALGYLGAFAAFVALTGAPFMVALRRILPRDWGWLPVLAYPGLFMDAVLGQNGFASALCFSVPVLFLERFPLLSGAALGCLIFKPHLALCVPIALLAARRWRAFFAAGASALTWLLAAWIAFGAAPYRAFFHTLPFTRYVLENHEELWSKFQSVFTASRLAGMPIDAAYVAQVGVLVGACAMVAVVCWRRPGSAAEAATLAAAALLCTPYVFDYDLTVTAVPLAWLASEAAKTGWRPWEKSIAATVFAWPVMARLATFHFHLPLGPLPLLGLFLVVWSRSAGQQAVTRMPRDT